MMRTNSPASSNDQPLNDKCYAYCLFPESGKVSLENFCLAALWTILLHFHSCLSSEASVFITPFVLVSLSQQLTKKQSLIHSERSRTISQQSRALDSIDRTHIVIPF